MSNEMDFKALWNKQATSDIPDTKELLVRAANIKKNTRNKLIGLNVVLLATAAIILWVGFNIDNEQLNTKIGIGMIMIALASYLIASNQLMPMLFKDDMQGSSHEYLNQLIRIKRKEDFLNKVMINIYFALLSAGLLLYSLQFAARMSMIWAITYYTITFGFIAYFWFYRRPRGVKKKQKALNDMIAKLEEVDRQLGDGH